MFSSLQSFFTSTTREPAPCEISQSLKQQQQQQSVADSDGTGMAATTAVVEECPHRSSQADKDSCSSDKTVSIVTRSPLTFIDSTLNVPQARDERLPSRRQISSIPRTSSSSDPYHPQACPHAHRTHSVHVPANGETQTTSLAASNNVAAEEGKEAEYWVYPSQKQFYEAMKRKNYQPKEEDMAVLVPLHNIINERAWQQILMWEKKYTESCAQPMLKQFTGKPNELSPKARMRSLAGYALPFDRHDWVVDRCGTDVRYVLDFYQGEPNSPSALVHVHIDARPALDSWQAVRDRLMASLG